MNNAFYMSREELMQAAGTDPEHGLSESQVQASRQKYGANTFVRTGTESMLKRIWDASTEPMLLMLIFAAIITLAVNITRYFTGGEYNFLECAGIFAAIFLSVAITIVTEGKSAKAFEALSKINEDTLIKVLRDGEPQLIPQKDIVIGDILLIETGDKIVADGRLISGNDLSADESALTGESLPVKKTQHSPAKKTPLSQSGPACSTPAVSSPAAQARCWSPASATILNSARSLKNFPPSKKPPLRFRKSWTVSAKASPSSVPPPPPSCS